MSAVLLNSSLVPDGQIYLEYLDKSARKRTVEHTGALSAIPRPSVPSCGPIATFSALLDQFPGRWKILELQRIYVEVWKLLPEEAKAGRAVPEIQSLLDHTLRQCKSSYSSILDLYHLDSSADAIIDPERGQIANHKDVASIVRNFDLHIPRSPSQTKAVVAISLPNGPLLAITVLATATYYTAAPVAHGSGVGKDQFKSDVLQSRANLVLASSSDVDRLGLHDSWLEDAGISVLLVDSSDDMELVIRDLEGGSINHCRNGFPAARPVPNAGDDTAILLFTSGTSGTKKLVPVSVHAIICGVAMVVESWGLSPSMRCLNQMPLNHVGGLIRNLFAPVFSGGSVICCSAFDANLFWDCVEDYAPTWYYASPSMHQVILDAGASRPESMQKSRIRLICNAAGGLLPSLAAQLRDTFSTSSAECIVLPSYGMTECMPISTPPLNYRLEKTGTSGISVGPEIAILDGQGQILTSNGVVGHIAVRGAPVFRGYLGRNNVLDQSCFHRDGWFDTGDMGFLDQEGYLYITGRSKEIINRGGELVSPFEVEEAIVAAASNPESSIYGRVSKALAFSVPHDVLQEVIGLAVVTPEGAPRPCLRGISEAVKLSLSQVKVPVLLVYMDGGLPTNNSKVLRIKLADRLNLPEISDSTPLAGRYFEAVCPPPNTPLSKSIPCSSLKVSQTDLEDVCNFAVPAAFDYYVKAADFYPELFIAPKSGVLQSNRDGLSSEQQLLANLYSHLHGYAMPTKVTHLDEPFPRDSNDKIDEAALYEKLNRRTRTRVSSEFSPTEATVGRLVAQVLNLPMSEVSNDSNFFELGGDSMGAGRLLTALRKEYSLRLPINILFKHSKIFQLAKVIDDQLSDNQSDDRKFSNASSDDISCLGCEKTCSSTNPVLLCLQLFPIVFIYPLKRALTWTIFMYMLTETQRWPTNTNIPGRLFNLVVSLAVGKICTRIVAPIVGIALKWFVIGRYQEGLYPMWGSYHTRWWLVQKTVMTCGMGFFGMSNLTKNWYFRLLGAKVGKNVSIQKGTVLGEWDLITIEDNAILEKCFVRPFAAERNTSMYLGRIHIGASASVGLASIVAAGTSVPANACIGPNSSSWEIADAEEANRDLATSKVPDAHWALVFFLGLPLKGLVLFIESIPWLVTLVGLVINAPRNTGDLLIEVMAWWSSPYRVGVHYGALAANVVLGPACFYLAVLVFKESLNIICGGPIRPSTVNERSQMTTFRMAWLRDMMPAKKFHELTQLFGTHYEATSVLARALGSKVGKRVYWPGTGPSVQDWDLLQVDHDVVFGSRSHIVTSDGIGSNFVQVKANAMVADRVVLLPGVKLGERAVMGSGALTKRNASYARESTWVGSKNGEAICLSTNHFMGPTSSRLGRLSQDYNKSKAHRANLTNLNSTGNTPIRGWASQHTSGSEAENSHRTSGRSSSEINKDPSTSYDDEKSITVLVPGDSTPSYFASGVESGGEQTEISSPFGRAFYEGKATYRVWGQCTIFLYSTLVTIVNGVWWNVPSVSAVQIVSRMYSSDNDIVTDFLADRWWRPFAIYIFFSSLIVGIMALQTIIVLTGLIASKWMLMGRRRQGNYDWDKSPYCQRWQLFLKLETFRRHCYGGHGILGMLTGTHWIVLYFRALGAKIGKDCSLFANGLPQLYLTEPDLLTLGDRVAVDDASLVGHINTRGKFDLNPLSVGSRSVLRSGSRLLSGARMEEDACLMEHTLVMAGEVVDAGCTAQGWPAEDFKGSRIPTMATGRHQTVKSKE